MKFPQHSCAEDLYFCTMCIFMLYEFLPLPKTQFCPHWKCTSSLLWRASWTRCNLKTELWCGIFLWPSLAEWQSKLTLEWDTPGSACRQAPPFPSRTSWLDIGNPHILSRLSILLNKNGDNVVRTEWWHVHYSNEHQSRYTLSKSWVLTSPSSL